MREFTSQHGAVKLVLLGRLGYRPPAPVAYSPAPSAALRCCIPSSTSRSQSGPPLASRRSLHSGIHLGALRVDLRLFASLRRALPIRDSHLDLSQQRYYLFRFVPLCRHDSNPSSEEFSLISTGTILAGHARVSVDIDGVREIHKFIS